MRLLRQRALEDRKEVVVPSHALRTGFRVLADIRKGLESFASTLEGLDEIATVVALSDIDTLAPIDLVVTGAVAATRDGNLLGASKDYFKLELSLMLSTGLINEDVFVIAAVHDCQIVELVDTAEFEPAIVDLIITPRETYNLLDSNHRAILSSDIRIDNSLFDDNSELRSLLISTDEAGIF